MATSAVQSSETLGDSLRVSGSVFASGSSLVSGASGAKNAFGETTALYATDVPGAPLTQGGSCQIRHPTWSPYLVYPTGQVVVYLGQAWSVNNGPSVLGVPPAAGVVWGGAALAAPNPSAVANGQSASYPFECATSSDGRIDLNLLPTPADVNGVLQCSRLANGLSRVILDADILTITGQAQGLATIPGGGTAAPPVVVPSPAIVYGCISPTAENVGLTADTTTTPGSVIFRCSPACVAARVISFLSIQ